MTAKHSLHMRNYELIRLLIFIQEQHVICQHLYNEHINSLWNGLFGHINYPWCHVTAIVAPGNMIGLAMVWKDIFVVLRVKHVLAKQLCNKHDNTERDTHDDILLQVKN